MDYNSANNIIESEIDRILYIELVLTYIVICIESISNIFYMKHKKHKGINKGLIKREIIKEETKHNHLIPDRIKKKLQKTGKKTFQKFKKNKKPCEKKNRYSCLEEANEVILRRQKESPGIYLRAYECDSCRWWHLTSQTEEDNIQREIMFDSMKEQNRTQKQNRKNHGK